MVYKVELCTGFELKKPVFFKRNRFEKKTGDKLKRKKKIGFETGFQKIKTGLNFYNRFQKIRKKPFFGFLFLRIFIK